MTGLTVVALHAVGLTKTYGDAPALGPVDLDVAAGERVVLVGHNGSGKTTLLRIAAGVLDATAGTITIAGNDVGSMEARAFTSYLGDQPAFYDDLPPGSTSSTWLGCTTPRGGSSTPPSCWRCSG